MRYCVPKASLKRRRLEKPLANAISMTGNFVSVSNCFARSKRRVLHQLDWRHAELLLHDAPQLTRAHPKLRRDFLQPGALVDQSFIDAARNEMSDPIRVIDRRPSRRQFRPAPQTRTEQCFLRGEGALE